ncbi:MAG: DUF86 domain-containing protein [Gammaproteobacteria bacterium]|jgi:uncharacterized protein YutE (UPF0331/DUF86 family)|nr:DUF86 domain-containing protein [Gammaproteobacteria bacterium]
MDQVIVREKLESLRRCIARVEEKRPENAAALEADIDAQDIIVLNLTRAVQMCVDIGAHVLSDSNQAAPQSMAGVFEALERIGVISADTALALRKAVGFRNIAVHSYDAINWVIVFSISDRHLADFKAFAKDVADYCLD